MNKQILRKHIVVCALLAFSILSNESYYTNAACIYKNTIKQDNTIRYKHYVANTFKTSYENKFKQDNTVKSKLGFIHDDVGIKFYYEADKFYRDGWHWIDNNADGIYECYYFNVMGHIYQDAITYDGHEVNEKGQLKIDGITQHKTITELFAVSTGSIISRKKIDQKKSINEADYEVLSELETDLKYITEQAKEELYIKIYSREYTKNDIKKELSIYITKLDTINVKYFKELTKMKDEKVITSDIWDILYNNINKATSKYKSILQDYIKPHIDAMTNYDIDF